MAHTAKTKGDLTKKKILGTVDKSVGSYEKHPFFIKKANAAYQQLITAKHIVVFGKNIKY